MVGWLIGCCVGVAEELFRWGAIPCLGKSKVVLVSWPMASLWPNEERGHGASCIAGCCRRTAASWGSPVRTEALSDWCGVSGGVVTSTRTIGVGRSVLVTGIGRMHPFKTKA